MFRSSILCIYKSNPGARHYKSKPDVKVLSLELTQKPDTVASIFESSISKMR